jgi:hypothetical protein
MKILAYSIPRCAVLVGILMATMAFPEGSNLNTANSSQNDGHSAAATSLLSRRYEDGKKLAYHMQGLNEGWDYEVQANGTVKRGPTGYYEEFQWDNLVFNKKAITLPPQSQQFRQQVTLDPEVTNSVPDLAHVHPMLVGPVTDLLTFYSDLWLAIRTGKLNKPGDHYHVPYGIPVSWADGSRILIGQDAIDFDLYLKEIVHEDHVAIVEVQHVPSQHPNLKFPAEWMSQPVSDTPNNWIVVEKKPDGKCLAQVGKETFDVQLKTSLIDGTILSAVMQNPIIMVERECSDQSLADCGPARRRQIKREIHMLLQQ